ncbi:MAG: hypothetical protein ACK5UE_07775 [Chitinophagales bacterium]|jgi:hypothetical protein|nr:hypothetical protein [Sphingobacteriales bacterium]
MQTKCPNNTIGMMNVGHQLNGKYKIAMLGWSKASFYNGEGAERRRCWRRVLPYANRQIAVVSIL